LVVEVSTAQRSGEVVGVDNDVLGHPRGAVLTARGVPVETVEGGQEPALVTPGLAQVSPAKVQRLGAGGFDDDLGRGPTVGPLAVGGHRLAISVPREATYRSTAARVTRRQVPIWTDSRAPVRISS